MGETAMSDTLASPALEAKSPFELRIDMSKDVPETDVRTALATGDMGFLHSFTTGATVDGPGVRVVAWTSGCMWRCQYCHNPDTWNMSNGMPVSVEKAAGELRKYRQGLKIMGGGFTLSGGEPLMQHRFALKLFSAAKTMGIHTALDTNGTLGDRLSDEDLEVIDLVLLDIKALDAEKHKALTGADNTATLAFARRLAERKRPVWLRYVVVPGLTDDMNEITRIAEFAGALGNIQRVDVLPFHQMGRFKWKKLGIPYALETTSPPDQELIERVCGVFRAAGLKAL
jgi:pyruvate formate lyase activating enzyme